MVGCIPKLILLWQGESKNTGTVTSPDFMMQYEADKITMIYIQGFKRRYP
jgi:hypothetical protein